MKLTRLLFLLAFTSLSASATERLYYVAADEVIWDYAPAHKNLMLNKALSEGQRGHPLGSPGQVFRGKIF